MKKLAGFLIALMVVRAVGAIEVDRTEIDTGEAGKMIEFINYNGPHDQIETAEQIRGIGADLGKNIVSAGSAGDRNRYYVIHAVDPAAKTGFDADILVIGPGARVDHIDNIRRILSAYLSAAYGYSGKDASTLATFITVYNAVYRGKMDVFTSRYKPVVTANLTADKVGLSLRYDEWPGKTQIVIPLSEQRLSGTISAIDTTVISSKDVVEKMREDTGAGVDTRKDMVDLKERESGAAQERADTAQKAAAQAKTEAAAKTAEMTAAQKAADDAKKAAEAARAEAAAKPADATAQEKALAAQKTAEDTAQAAAAKTAEAAAAQEKVAASETAAAKDQALADTKQKEALTERKEIASDVQKELNEQTAAAQKAAESALALAEPAYGLRIVDQANLLSELVIVNLNDGSVMKTSPLNVIRGRTVYDTGAGLIAIAGKKEGTAAVRLVLIDPKTLDVTKQGVDNISEQSVLVKSENDYFAVIEQPTGGFVVGRFDLNLEAKAKSAVQVNPATAIIVTAKGLLVQDSAGTIRLLRTTDLVDQTGSR